MRKFKGGNSYITCGVAIAAASLAISKPAHAAYTLVDDFNRAAPAPPNQFVVGGAFAGNEVDGDPGYDGVADQVALSNNQMQIFSTTEDTYNTDLRAYTFHSANVTSATSTIFFQMTLTDAVATTANTWNAGFAISKSNNSSDHGKDLFSVYANGGGTSVPLSINSGANADMTNNGAVATGTSITPGTTYNFWLELNSTTGKFDLYENTGGAATIANLVASDVSYGDGTALFSPVNLTFYANSADFVTDNGFGTAALNGSNSFNIDNIYVDASGVPNLADPTAAAVPEPASLSLLGLTSGALLLRRRRHA